jgi:hypothetical protein
VLLAALGLLACTAPAAASVTIGQLATSTAASSAPNVDFLQRDVSLGAGYVVPENGTITSWTHNAANTAGQTLTMKVFRKVSEPAFYKAIGHDGPRPLTGGLLNTFATSIPVQTGDVIGLGCLVTSSACLFPGDPGDKFFFKGVPTLNDGDAAAFTGPSSSSRVNVTAVLEPSNTLTVGKTSFNKKKGTATLNLTVPNPGVLTGSGNGVKAASAGAVTSKSVTAGPATLLIKAKGKKRKALSESGSVKLNVSIAYTPANGTLAKRSLKVKLKQN